MQNSGIAALYLCSATLLAGILLTVILSYKLNIDSQKWYRALAILQGVELDEIQKAERARVAEMRFEEVLSQRAVQDRQNEYNRDITQRMTSFTLPPEDPKQPPPPPPPSVTERIDAYEKRVADDLARSRATGLAEEIRLIENMKPDQAKEVLRKYWKDGLLRRVIQILMGMEEDRNREKILYAMKESNDEELKDLCEILQKIGDGEPMSSIIDSAGREP